jgi:non-homologous end joining protein Ku
MRGTNSQFILTRTTDGKAPLFAFPVKVCKATASPDVKFDRVTPDGGKAKAAYRDEVTGKIYETADLVRGINGPDGFVKIDPELIENIDERVAIEGIEVLTTVDLADVPTERVEGFYYLEAPAEAGSHKAYRLVYEALLPQAQKGQGLRPKPPLSLLVRYTSRSRQKLAVIYSDADRQALVLLNLSFAESVREPDKAILAAQQVEVEAEQVAMTRKVIEGLADEAVTVDTPTDEAIVLKRELVEKATAGELEAEPVEKADAPVPAEDGLDALLEASLA